ncbi:class I SAM-dependent methyltransferase [Actinomadura roseirufa]|uniref:class I SAM-dependent methyltransferase n=1 Tax=Actinomadura roseirufa TaxID=2094049 RepID=UPI0010413307|nr:class I SAM-dependent methyltransferase [Actinomadura roseirufa]
MSTSTANAVPGEPHRHREIAESFGADAERYDRTRPDYPGELMERIAAAGPRVLDVGCGTGIVARRLRAAGCAVLGVDPDARMAAWAERSGIETEVATFEEWESAGRTFDAVVAGQTWHWVDPVAGAAKAARVLRPGGRLALFWNVMQAPPEMTEGMTEVYRRILPDSPAARTIATPALDVYGGMFATAADAIRGTGAFGEPEHWRFEWERLYTRDEWLEQVPTFGGNAGLPPDVLRRLLDGIGAAVDAVGGAFTMAYTTVAVTAERV